jgi:hypothetical protein
MMNEEMDKRFLDRLRLNEPHLKDPEALKNQVLSRIEKSRSNRFSSMRWIKAAAAILLVVGFGNLGWQELSTRYAVSNLTYQSKTVVPTEIVEPRCTEKLHDLMAKLDLKPFNRLGTGYVIRLSLGDFALLQNTHSPYLAEATLFLRVMEKYYPDDYIRFMNNGETDMSVKQLMNDHRICEMLKR